MSIELDPPPPLTVRRDGRTRGWTGTGHDWIPPRREGGREPSPRMGPENHHQLIKTYKTRLVTDCSRSNQMSYTDQITDFAS